VHATKISKPSDGDSRREMYPEASDPDWVIDLGQGDAEIHLSQHAGDGAFG
jgi:hypothetical protein